MTILQCLEVPQESSKAPSIGILQDVRLETNIGCLQHCYGGFQRVQIQQDMLIHIKFMHRCVD